MRLQLLHPLEQRLVVARSPPARTACPLQQPAAFDANPSSTTTSAKCGWSSVNRRFAALLRSRSSSAHPTVTSRPAPPPAPPPGAAGSTATGGSTSSSRPCDASRSSSRNAPSTTRSAPCGPPASTDPPATRTPPALRRAAPAQTALSIGSTYPDVAQPHIRRRPLHPEQTRRSPAAARADSPTPRAVLLELQHGVLRNIANPDIRSPPSSAHGFGHLVLDPLEAASHLRQQPRHRQRLAKLRLGWSSTVESLQLWPPML